MSQLFTTMAKCEFFKFGYSGSIVNYDALCVLPLNIVNQSTCFFGFISYFLLRFPVFHLFIVLRPFFMASFVSTYYYLCPGRWPKNKLSLFFKDAKSVIGFLSNGKKYGPHDYSGNHWKLASKLGGEQHV